MADKVKEPVKTEKRWFGIFLAAVSPLMYELSSMTIKYTFIQNKGIPLLFESVLLNNVSSFVITSSSLLVDRVNPLVGERKQFLWLLLAAFMKISGNILFCMALTYIDLGTQMTVYAIYPFFAMILALIFLRERMTAFEIFLAVVSVIGVVFVVKTSNSHHHNSQVVLGVSLVCLAGLFVSAYMVLIRKNADKIDFRLPIFHASIIGIILNSLILVISKSNNIVLLSDDYIYLLLSSGIFYFLGVVLEVIALRYERAGIIGLFKNIEVLWAYMFDVVVQHFPLTTSCVLGALLVIFASVLVGLNRLYNLDEIIVKKIKKNTM